MILKLAHRIVLLFAVLLLPLILAPDQSVSGELALATSTKEKPFITQRNPLKSVALNLPTSELIVGSDTEITAVVTYESGEPVPNQLVVLSSTVGLITPDNGVTDENGRLTVEFQAGEYAGIAAITALAGSQSASTTIEISDPQKIRIDSIEPESGSIEGGEKIKIRGENFSDELKVLIGNQPCLNMTILSQKELHCISPQGILGPANVVLNYRDNDSTFASLVSGFTYTEPAPPQFAEFSYLPLVLSDLQSNVSTSNLIE